MKINSINIVSFGKIKNLKIDFSESLNILYGDNEAGKTHIADFIKMMFYGTAARGSGVNNLRKKYKPWDNAKMGGSIDFTKDGTRYRVEREFKATNSSDTIILHNLDLGTHQNLSGNDNFGEQIFGISIGAFQQSVFIDNSVVFAADDKGELNLKLANISNSADEDISFEKILKNISSAKETLISKNRKLGPIPEAETKIEDLKIGRQNAIRIYEEAEKKAEEIAELEARLNAASKEKSKLFEQLKAYEQHALKEKLTDFKEAVEIYNETEKQLTLKSGTIINADFLNSLEDKLQALKIKEATLKAKVADNEREAEEISKIADAIPSSDEATLSLKTKKSALESDLLSAENALTELNSRRTFLENESMNSKKKGNPILIILGALLTALGVAAGFFYTYLFTFAATGLILLILGLTIKPNNQSNAEKLANTLSLIDSENAKKEELKKEIAAIEAEITALIIKTGTNNSLLQSKKEEALKNGTELIKLNSEFEAEKSAIFSEISQFKQIFDIPSADAALDEIKSLLDNLSAAEIRAQAAIAHTGCKSTEDALRKLESIPSNLPEINDTREMLQEKFNASGKNCTDISGEITRLTAELKAATNGIPNPKEYERNIAECEEALSSMLSFVENSDIALEVLEEAYAEQRRSWGGVLQSRALQIFSSLTGGRYTDMSISKDFEITVKAEEDITSHAAEYLSRGTLHQAYFALRLALSEFLLETSGSLPIILDDVFSQYDNSRTATGFEFLKEYSKDNQVLFFTCHEELAKISGANLITLN